MHCSQKLGEDFAKFCGLLRIYELYRKSVAADFRTKYLGDGLIDVLLNLCSFTRWVRELGMVFKSCAFSKPISI